MDDTNGDLWLAYDGECPICQFGVRHARIRETVGEIRLIDARTESDHPVMQEIKARGINVDEGMIAKWGGNFYHGADALQLLAMLGTDRDWLNRLNARLFRSRTLSRLCYPFMRAGRRMALMAKGVPPL
jgi:predicted DCC family thiol-disulfide oxidoreductase YuxK